VPPLVVGWHHAVVPAVDDIRQQHCQLHPQPACILLALGRVCYASFIIRVGDPVHSLGVPEAGVVREGDGTMTVWTTRDNRHFVRRTVTTGIRQNGWVQIILDGLQPGETVVTDGAVFLSNKLLLSEAG
jgi:hypothetical protein